MCRPLTNWARAFKASMYEWTRKKIPGRKNKERGIKIERMKKERGERKRVIKIERTRDRKTKREREERDRMEERVWKKNNGIQKK